MSDEIERSALNYDDPPPPGEYKTIATFSAEQTANFLAGGPIGKPKYTDPEMQAKVDHQRAMLREAFADVTQTLCGALIVDSPSTHDRLQELSEAALIDDPDPNAVRLYAAMVAQLIDLGLTP